MIKSELRSTVLNRLQKYDKTARFHNRVIDANIEKVLNETYNALFLASPLSIQRFTKRYGYATPIAVSLEVATSLYYSTLPVTNGIVPFPDKASGVRRISTPTQGAIAFYPMDEREMDLIANGSYYDYVTSKVGYVVRQDRVEYHNMPASVIASGVRMDIVVPFSEYADTDIVLVPEIQSQEGKDLVDLVVDKMMAIPPVDTIDDNADKTE